MGQTLADKIWTTHLVRSAAGEPDLIYIDMHLLHEVNTPLAFDGLRAAGRSVRRPDLTLGTIDHQNATDDEVRQLTDPAAILQIDHMKRNCADFGIDLYAPGNARRGIAHVIGPELGLTQPGMTLVCCDSHTSTHGAFGVLAFGIGTSQVEHVLATQTLPMAQMKNMRVTVDGALPLGATAKDLILAVIAEVGTAGGQGHVIEYQGEAIRALSMEGRMTVCNMSIEAGARAGLVAPDRPRSTICADVRTCRPVSVRRRGRVLVGLSSPTTTPCSTRKYTSTRPRSCPALPGAPTPPSRCHSMTLSHTRSRSSTRWSAPLPSARCATWICAPAPACAT